MGRRCALREPTLSTALVINPTSRGAVACSSIGDPFCWAACDAAGGVGTEPDQVLVALLVARGVLGGHCHLCCRQVNFPSAFLGRVVGEPYLRR